MAMNKTRCTLCGFTQDESGERMIASCNCSAARQDVHLSCFRSYTRQGRFSICTVCHRRVRIVSTGYKPRRQWTVPEMPRSLKLIIAATVLCICAFLTCLITILAAQCWKAYCIAVLIAMITLTILLMLACCCSGPSRSFWRSALVWNKDWVLMDESPITSLRRNAGRSPSGTGESIQESENKPYEKDGLRNLGSLWTNDYDRGKNPIFVSYDEDSLPPYAPAGDKKPAAATRNMHDSLSKAVHTDYIYSRAESFFETANAMRDVKALTASPGGRRSRNRGKERPKSEVPYVSHAMEDDPSIVHRLHRSQTAPESSSRGNEGEAGGISRRMRRDMSRRSDLRDDAGLSATLERLSRKQRPSSEKGRQRSSSNTAMPYASDVSFRPATAHEFMGDNFQFQINPQATNSILRPRSAEAGLNVFHPARLESFAPTHSKSDPYISYTGISSPHLMAQRKHPFGFSAALPVQESSSVYKGTSVITREIAKATPEPKAQKTEGVKPAEQEMRFKFDDPRPKLARPKLQSLFFAPDSK